VDLNLVKKEKYLLTNIIIISMDVKVLKAGLLAGSAFAIIDLFLSLILISIDTMLFGVRNLFEVFISLHILLRLVSKPIVGLLMGIFFLYFEKRIPIFYKSQKFSERANKAASFGFIVGLIFAILSLFLKESYSETIVFHIVLWPVLFGFFVNKFCK
jgi:hypothetical protein